MQNTICKLVFAWTGIAFAVSGLSAEPKAASLEAERALNAQITVDLELRIRNHLDEFLPLPKDQLFSNHEVDVVVHTFLGFGVTSIDPSAMADRSIGTDFNQFYLVSVLADIVLPDFGAGERLLLRTRDHLERVFERMGFAVDGQRVLAASHRPQIAFQVRYHPHPMATSKLLTILPTLVSGVAVLLILFLIYLCFWPGSSMYQLRSNGHAVGEGLGASNGALQQGESSQQSVLLTPRLGLMSPSTGPSLSPARRQGWRVQSLSEVSIDDLSVKLGRLPIEQALALLHHLDATQRHELFVKLAINPTLKRQLESAFR